MCAFETIETSCNGKGGCFQYGRGWTSRGVQKVSLYRGTRNENIGSGKKLGLVVNFNWFFGPPPPLFSFVCFKDLPPPTLRYILTSGSYHAKYYANAKYYVSDVYAPLDMAVGSVWPSFDHHLGPHIIRCGGPNGGQMVGGFFKTQNILHLWTSCVCPPLPLPIRRR